MTVLLPVEYAERSSHAHTLDEGFLISRDPVGGADVRISALSCDFIPTKTSRWRRNSRHRPDAIVTIYFTHATRFSRRTRSKQQMIEAEANTTSVYVPLVGFLPLAGPRYEGESSCDIRCGAHSEI
jgi:hypothetical protein